VDVGRAVINFLNGMHIHARAVLCAKQRKSPDKRLAAADIFRENDAQLWIRDSEIFITASH